MAITEVRPFIFNLETTKIELHFSKEEYNKFSADEKKRLHSGFLFSGKSKCWVSRAKEPNLYRAKEIAKTLGFIEEQREGERLSYAEQLAQRTERAENRADCFETYASNAENRAEALQKPLNDRHGDIAFFTQPIIPGHSGSQSFARYREKLFARYERGFEEYRKSDYFKSRAETARITASMEKLNDKGYLDRRIKECRKEIRSREKNILQYEKYLARLENGEEVRLWNGNPVTEQVVIDWLNRELELTEVAQDKEGYLLNQLDMLGGVEFNSGNVGVGCVVSLKRFGEVEVIGKGKQNITYVILTGGAKGLSGKAAYAEIQSIVRAEAEREVHPFKKGDTFTASIRTYAKDFSCTKSQKVFEIIKISETTIQLTAQGETGKTITRKPRKTYDGSWAFSINQDSGNTFYKRAECE
ncbi:hypothetical protein OBV_p-00220 (plasmid) [Oscillibacter valericigenes Sjm18-20]|nr:hypothetical protein OBV_p-00220 [Oscillibacter valericigenes Sjm18-20]